MCVPLTRIERDYTVNMYAAAFDVYGRHEFDAIDSPIIQ